MEIVFIFKWYTMFSKVYRLIELSLVLPWNNICKGLLSDEDHQVWCPQYIFYDLIDYVLQWVRDIQKSWSRARFFFKVELCHYLELLYVIKAYLYVVSTYIRIYLYFYCISGYVDLWNHIHRDYFDLCIICAPYLIFPLLRHLLPICSIVLFDLVRL